MTDIKNNLEAAVSDMAFRLWEEEHKHPPKASDAESFLVLVAACREALSGKKASKGYNLAKMVGESPHKG
ncbi:hypothetical protein [Sphingopyxis sp. SCN 67-31]|uniref:hypothetical protein n=1 Tax=Sphingopyxis sp. SCN 67-31 TaxID=1660142 RepID=UPI00086B6404|nr:hypothetical protein [Sphingopyxis sp. SCN 67-31]ODU34449.1 MAG: hypothetical protein ABS88_02135 [Sphingopyxis sp. SCN 67-31]